MKGQAGYSLVEALIAFVIMTMVLATLIPGQAALLGRASVVEETVLAQDYALSQVARLGIDVPLTPGTTQTTYRDWTIETTVSDAGIVAIGRQMLNIAIEVTDRQGQLLAMVETLRVAP